MEPPYDRRDASSINSRRQYLLAELDRAALRARLWRDDIEAVGLALKGTLITPEQALELLHGCDVLRLVGPLTRPSNDHSPDGVEIGCLAKLGALTAGIAPPRAEIEGPSAS